MDVTCERCGTRYEFDEALVSARGTTVKCTSCGHQFKVYRPDGAQELDGWLVRTIDGRELAFAAMRELQAAITSGQIAPDDVLIPKSGGAPRRLSRIEELQSFFVKPELEPATQRHARRPAAAYGLRGASPYPEHKGTLLGGTHAPGAAAVEPARQEEAPKEPVRHRTGNTLRPPTSIPPEPATLPRADYVPEDLARASFEEPAPPQRRNGSVAVPLAKTSQYGSDDAIEALDRAVHEALERESTPHANPQANPHANPQASPQASNPARPSNGRASRDELPSVSDEDTIGDDSIEEGPRISRPVSSLPPRMSEPPSSDEARISLDPLTPTPSAARPSVLRGSDVYSDPRFSGYNRGRRPGIVQWVVGLVGLGLVAVVGFTFFKKELIPQAAPTATAAPDARADGFLDEGERRLLEGDVEGAQEQFVKASAVAESDPRVARALARVAVVRADLLWLHKELTRPGTPHHEAVAHQLEGAVVRARKAADAALAKAPSDPVGQSLGVDVLRLEGRTDEARKLVSKLEGAGPDGARALAALDLTEESPSYGSVLDRLRSATRAERKLGRAHAMLIYALVRAGKVEAAKEELASLEESNPGHALLAVLRHQVEGTEPPEEAPPEPKAPRPTAQPQPPPAPVAPPPGRVEPFATAEPDAVTPPPEPTGDDHGEAPPPPPPEIDVTDLPEYH